MCVYIHTCVCVCVWITDQSLKTHAVLSMCLNFRLAPIIYLVGTMKLNTYICSHSQEQCHVWLSATLCGSHSPLSMRFSRQEYWSGLPSPTPGDLPSTGIKPTNPASAGGFASTELPVHMTVINFPVHQTHILPRSCTTCWESTVNKMEIFLPHCNKFSVWWSQKNEETYNAFWQKCHLNEKLVKHWTEVAKSFISVTRINEFGLRTF